MSNPLQPGLGATFLTGVLGTAFAVGTMGYGLVHVVRGAAELGAAASLTVGRHADDGERLRESALQQEASADLYLRGVPALGAGLLTAGTLFVLGARASLKNGSDGPAVV